MNFEEFSARAQQIFEDIPPEYRAGVDGVEVTRRTSPHPSLPDVFTLGECLSEFYPSDYGGPGEVQSRVVLYYGSFNELARAEDEWDWEGELWETITHEIRHHLEHLATEDALEELDYAEDENFARRDGKPFDPFFFRSGHPVGPGTFEVDGDFFVERPVDRRSLSRSRSIDVTWRGRDLSVPIPDDLGDVHYLHLAGTVEAEDENLFLVLVRRRGAREWIADLLGGPALRVLETTVHV